MTNFFAFEADFVDSLRCIPMGVRLKLDSCGIKLKLPQWNKFSEADRQALVEMPCLSDEDVENYRRFLHNLVLERTATVASELPIDENPAWLNEEEVPVSVVEKAAEFGLNLTLEKWQKLSALQRFALIKLSRSGHENNNFLPALKEFGLVV
ncbi:nitrate reductase associated protein [Ancylothrix sp. C2]|uniref:nitrate reductase associated protein n=1 Tax=Ancylothrix sp. D3o TaxID=2953691 RepID=UPI0021BB53DB|nr:nitrate reductase associated protein [Ancylothrix sp. D3o]MCT7951163.1 nitrate reductase associated protein [Ancylothrix sp. D3o]